MFAIKFIFGVLLVVLSTKIAVIKAKTLKEKYLYYSSAKLMCEGLESELLYFKRPLNEALNIDYPSFYFAKTVKSVIENGYIDAYPEFLTLEERGKFDGLFLQLGRTDTEAQKACILSNKEDFLKLESEKRVEYNKFYTLTLKLGFLIGVMLFVLVI